MTMRCAILFAASLFVVLAATPGVSITPVFGPETPTGRYKHPASITELENGDLFLAWYGGDGEYEPGTAVWGSRCAKADSKWSAPVMLARDPFYSVGNPVIWQAPDGLVWLWYVIRPGQTWSSSRIAVKVSKDGARTWSDSSVVSFEEGTMVRGRPIVLKNGDYLLPVWKETGFDQELVGTDTVSFFLRYNPAAKKWTATGRYGGRIGALQPTVAQIDDAYLIAYSRRGGGYSAGTSGFIVRSESRDGGKTWAKGVDTEFPNPNAAIDLLKLHNGHLVLIYNDSPTDRTPLTVAISTDTGKSWAARKNIATGPHDYAYPFAIQTRDGKIHLVFTSEARTVINHAVFEESAITGH
jgi:predicted neuraminidase